MSKDNIIKIETPINTEDVSQKKAITIKEAAKILGLTYHTTRRRIYESGEIGFFDYDGKIGVIEEDVRAYKRNHYIKPKGVL